LEPSKSAGFEAAVFEEFTAAHPVKVAGLQQRIEALSKQAVKPLFLVDQFKVITENMRGEPVLRTDDDFAGVEAP
jgi:hypothetical protein